MISTMAGRHARTEKPLTAYIPIPVLRDAKTLLRARGHTMRALIVAALTALVDDPDRLLDTLTPHWPPEKPRGRPREKVVE